MGLERYMAIGFERRPCYFEGCSIGFRGPKVDTDAPYVVYLGGNETFGKFVAKPFPTMIAESFTTAHLNLGMANASVDMYLAQPALINLARMAQVSVIQVMSAANLSNTYYTVHPRRNDRFIRPTPMLRRIAPDLDLTDVHFTGHLLDRVRAYDEALFFSIRDDLHRVWQGRMRELIKWVGGVIVLLWINENDTHTPDAPSNHVDAAVVESICPLVDDVVVIERPSLAQACDGVLPSSRQVSANAHWDIAGKLSHSLARLGVV